MTLGENYVSGKIEARSRGCFADGRPVECNYGDLSLINRKFMDGAVMTNWSPDILPENLMADTRNDSLFFALFFATVLALAILGFSRAKIFGKPLGEYLKPIWYYVLGVVAVVFFQYLVVVPYGELYPSLARLSQLCWEVFVGLSVYQLVKKSDFGFGNVFFLGVLYSFIIHGLKVSIRYFFYGSTIYYSLDRFLYGSLLVMVITLSLGAIFLYFKGRGGLSLSTKSPSS